MVDDSVAIGVIVNPRADGGRALQVVPALAAALQRLDEPSYLSISTGPAEATATSRRLAETGARLVVAVGGDGTVNAVAAGLLAAGSPTTALGVVAAGRGLDFATALGVPNDPLAALSRALGGKVRRLDACRVECDGDRRDLCLVNAGGVGIDAEVAVRSAGGRVPGRRAPYLVALAAALPRFRPFAVEVEADGERTSERVLSVVVGNGPALGGGFALVPDAVMDDGMLDVAVVRTVSALDLIRETPTLVRGRRIEHRAVRRLRAATVRITIKDARKVRLQIDGEVVSEPGTRIRFTVLPRALQVAR